MQHQQHTTLVNFIWGIADDVLRDVYIRGRYRDVILPIVVVRRLDALLESTKRAVLGMKATLDSAGVANQEAALCRAAKQAFYNASPFTLADLRNRGKAGQLRPTSSLTPTASPTTSRRSWPSSSSTTRCRRSTSTTASAT